MKAPPSQETGFAYLRARAEWQGDCLVWRGHCDSQGYGVASWSGRQWRAHRLMYELHFGPVATGTLICHHCDNPPCINPEHLFAGSHSDNRRDMWRKHRRSPSRMWGDTNGQSRLAAEQIAEIRSSTESCRVLANRLGVGKSTVSDIRTGRRRPAARPEPPGGDAR